MANAPPIGSQQVRAGALAVLDTLSARLTTGSPHAPDMRVERPGQDPRLVAGSWLRAQGLAFTEGALH